MRRRFRPKDWPARKRRTGTPMVFYGVPVHLWQGEYLTRDELAARWPVVRCTPELELENNE